MVPKVSKENARLSKMQVDSHHYIAEFHAPFILEAVAVHVVVQGANGAWVRTLPALKNWPKAMVRCVYPPAYLATTQAAETKIFKLE